MKPWMFWTAAGATVASAGAAVFFTVRSSNAEDEWNDTVNAGVPGGDIGSVLVDISHRAEQVANRRDIALGFTAGFAVTTAVLAYFTDWHGARDTELLVRPGGAGLRTTF